MEKILQIVTVFGLLMLIVVYFIRGREVVFQEYFFLGRFTFPLVAGQEEWLSVVMPQESWEGVVDKENNLVFQRGVGGTMEIEDFTTGTLYRRIELGLRADGILFDPVAKLIYCCSTEGLLVIIKQKRPDDYRIVQRLQGPSDCKTLSLDPGNGKLYFHSGGYVYVYGV